jgi:hypothetical protein
LIPIVGVSLEEALLGFGGDGDAELHNKEVTLTTSDVTGSQTAIFEYDPQNEPTTGTPAGPWDGYSLFTIDLSGVKDDLEDLQQQVSNLEDELEEMQECCEDVAEILDATPEEGESCCDAVKRKAQDVVDKIEECDDCKDAVVAAIQQYVPSFTPDPATCNIPDGVDDVYEQGKEDEAEENPPGFEFEPDVTLPEISELIAGDVTISTPTSEWEVEVFLYAESYDGSVTKRVRTLHTGGESWFFRPAISFIHGDEEHVAMPMNYRYQIGPSASEWVSITGWSIDSSTSVSLSWINQDGYTRSWGGYYAGADLTPLMTGPYIVKNK